MSNDKMTQHWQDKQEIIELSYLYSRACDRLDRALLERVYWPDGSDDHGIFVGSAPDYVDWVMALLGSWHSSHHSNSNFLIEIKGDEAVGECHWTGFYRFETDGQRIEQLSAGRYLDKYLRRDGQWRIYHRRCVSEWSRSAPASGDWAAAGPGSRRDRGDPVYALWDMETTGAED